MDFGDSRGAVIGVLQMISTVLYPAVWAYVPLRVIVMLTVRGTRLRYIAASLVPVSIIGAMAYWAMQMVVSVLDDGPSWRAPTFAVFGVGANVFFWCAYKKDDDDTWWKGLGRRIKSQLARRRRRVVVAPA